MIWQLTRERDEAHKHVAELRAALELIRTIADEYPSETHDELLARSAIIAMNAVMLTPVDAICLQKARRAVVEAARKVDVAETMAQQDLVAAVAALEKLEAPCPPK